MVSSTSSGKMERPKGGIRDFKESRKHKEVIRQIALAYERDGFKVKADHIEEFEIPEICVVMRPDIRAKKDDKEIVVEVESRNSIGSRRDKMQRREFGEWAKKRSERDFRRETTI